MLGVEPDSRELDDIRDCALLSPPSTGLGNLETVSVHQVTRSVLKDLFLKDTFISAGKTDDCHQFSFLFSCPLSLWNGVEHASYEDDSDLM